MIYKLLKFIWKLFSLIPLSVMYILSDLLFYPFYYLIRYRRKVVRKNLTESFPEKSIEEITKIEKKFYHFFLDLFFETCKIATISEEEMKKRMNFSNFDLLNRSFENGKSITLYLGHFGCWEWISAFVLYAEKDIIGGQIYRKLSNGLIDRLMQENRSRFGAYNIERKETLRWINERITNKQLMAIGFIADQSTRKKDAKYFLPFLNHEVPVFTGAEKITKKYGMDAFYAEIHRPKRGYYEAVFVKMNDNPQQLPDFELTDMYYQYLENTICKTPELYLWTHNRFKHAKKIDN